MVKLKIAFSCILAVLCMLIPNVWAGCYQALSLSFPRLYVGVGNGNDKIFFAGGIYSNGTASTIIDIYDTTNEIFLPTFQLPVGRGQISIASIGSKVLFAGGQLQFSGSDYYPKVDIYDMETHIMQTMDFDISPVSNKLKSLVVGSRVFLYSTTSTAMLIVDPNANTMDTLQLPRRPTSIVAGGDRVFLLGQDGRLIFHVLNLSNMTWNEPVYFVRNEQASGLVYFPRSLAVISYTRIINVDVDNPSRQVYQATVSERNVAAYNRIGEELYLIGPGFVTLYRPYARLLRFRSSNLFFASAESVEYNGIIYYAGALNNIIQAALFDTRGLLHTPENFGEDVQTFGYGYLHAAHGHLFGLLGGQGTIYAYNLQKRQQVVYRRALTFSTYYHGLIQSRRKLFVFTSLPEEYMVFDADAETWTTVSMPAIRNVRTSIASDDYIVRRNDSTALVLDIAANEWIEMSAIQYHPIHIVKNKIVLLEETTMKIFDMNTRQWRIGLQLNFFLRYGQTTVHNTTVLITGVGEGDEARKLHMYDVVTGEYRVEQFNGRRSMTIIVHGDSVIYAGGVFYFGATDFTTKVDIYNMRTRTWKSTTLPPNLSFNSPPRVVLGARDNSLFVARENRVDIVDIESVTSRALLIPIATPQVVTVTGSKVIFFSISNPGGIISVYETTTDTSFSYSYDTTNDDFLTTENFIVAQVFAVKVMELTTIMNRLEDVKLFIGGSVDFNVSVKGKVLDSYWQRDNERLANETDFSLALDHVSQDSSGRYAIQVLDQCSQRVTAQATLIVHGAPILTRPLEESLVMCHDFVLIDVAAEGEKIAFYWTFGGEHKVTTDPTLVIPAESFSCNSVQELCVVASNPSGSTRSCKPMRVLDHDAIFDGPKPTHSQAIWLSESVVTLTIQLLDDECTSHEWLMNGVPMNITGEDSSSIRVAIEPGIATASFRVVASCGSSKLHSHPFKFRTVSSWTVAAVVLTVIVAAIGVAVLGAIGFVVRRRMIASHLHEQELENMLTQAKSETLNLEGGIPIVQSTTWEWSPGEGFTYKPIDNMSFIVDYSSFNALGKESIRVGVWNQSIIEFSLRDYKPTKRGMRERLLDGTHIDIYAPRSPKYEIKTEPTTVELDAQSVTYVTVSTTMRMTAKCKVCLIVVNERDKLYSVIEFKISSGMSTWIDLDEIESNGEYLGGGGFGAVTLGTYRGQEVAVKKLLSQYLTDEMKIEFDREVTLMKDLRHPNIVQFIGASNIKNSLAIVIEFAPFGSVASVMQKHKLSTAMKITMLLETAKALQFLHTNGIIHRDIKPQNILVFSLEPKAPVHVKLTDFGTARFISDDATTITKNIGTIAFMAPEALGKNPRVDKSADVYSFAVLMWSMMCEKTPFSEIKWDSDIESHVKAGNRLPLLDDGSISTSMSKLIEDCWQHKPAQRPSMALVVQRLAAMSQ